MHLGAGSLDGLRAGDIKHLPDVAYEWFEKLFEKIERHKTWPLAVIIALMSLIPKG